jgi:uncharacterized protein
MDERRATRAFVAGLAVLLIYNVARGLGVFGSFGDASAILLFGAFVALAWRAGISASDLGLARDDARRGAMYGVTASIVTTLVLVIIAVMPATSDLFEDSRADVSGPRLVIEVVISIYFLTVIPEEFAFRGVLLASGRALWGDRVAILASSALFGLWHISPTLNTMSQNRQLDEATTTIAGTILVVGGSVLATFVAGLIFSWLRLRSRSLLAPVIAHLATNGVALALAWSSLR